MKKKDELIKTQGKLSPAEIEEIQWIKQELDSFLSEGDVSESGLVRLENVTDSIVSLKRNYTQRVVNMLKQGHMLD